jgi:tetratricopeptide (TPR) repeat protein
MDMNDKARSLLEAARHELGRKKTKRAVKYFDQAIEADPDAHEVFAERAAVAISPLRDYARAAEDLSSAIGRAPGIGAYYDMRGQAYWYLREYERALEDFDRAIAIDPACASAYYHRGNFYEKLQRYEQAIGDMRRAVELDYGNLNYKRRLVELNRAAILHAERLGEEPPAIALEETPAPAEAPPPPPVPEAPAPPVQVEKAPKPDVEPVPAPAEAQPAPPKPVEAKPAAPPAPAPPRAEVPVAPLVQRAAPGARTAAPAREVWSVRIASGEEFGPVSLAVLKRWAEEQRVKAEDYLLGPQGGWVSAGSVAEIAVIFEDLRTTRKPPVRPD